MPDMYYSTVLVLSSYHPFWQHGQWLGVTGAVTEHVEMMAALLLMLPGDKQKHKFTQLLLLDGRRKMPTNIHNLLIAQQSGCRILLLWGQNFNAGDTPSASKGSSRPSAASSSPVQ